MQILKIETFYVWMKLSGWIQFRVLTHSLFLDLVQADLMNMIRIVKILYIKLFHTHTFIEHIVLLE